MRGQSNFSPTRAPVTGLPDTGSSGALTEDALLGGAVRLMQPADGERVSIDTVFLAAAAPVLPDEMVLEPGIGLGGAALCLAHRVPHCRIIGIDRNAVLVRLAAENAKLNGFERRISPMVGDVRSPPPRLAPGVYAHIMMNPPHMAAARTDASPNPAKVAARVEDATFADWIAFALRMVRPRGTITMIHRADRLDEILARLTAGAGEIVVFPLWPGGGAPAKRVIVRARKGVQTPVRLSAGLTLHGDIGKYTPEADAVLRGAALNL